MVAPSRGHWVRFINELRGVRNRFASTAPNVARGNSQRAYDRLFADETLVAEYLSTERLRFYDEVVNAALELDPHRVIDVGCGTGDLLKRLTAARKLDRIVGLDFADAAVARASEIVPDATFVKANIRTWQTEERFDLVLCTEVLEHLNRPQQAVETLCALAERGGHVLVTVPDGAKDDWSGHVNFWAEAELNAFLGQFGEVDIRRVDNGASLLAVLRPA